MNGIFVFQEITLNHKNVAKTYPLRQLKLLFHIKYWKPRLHKCKLSSVSQNNSLCFKQYSHGHEWM